jgi:adenylyl- and sulfurtransferase ThiI
VKEELILNIYGEIALKARHTRLNFENLLISNIQNALKIDKSDSSIKKQVKNSHFIDNGFI